MKNQGYAVAGLMTILVLAACNRQGQAGLEPMPENQPSQATAKVAAAPATAAAPTIDYADHLTRNVKTDRYFTQIGTLFGPYAPLRAGTYNLLIVGKVDSLPDGGKVQLDVASAKGKVVHGGQEVSETGALPSFDVVVAKDAADVEVRVRVPQHAKVSVEAYQLVKKG